MNVRRLGTLEEKIVAFDSCKEKHVLSMRIAMKKLVRGKL